MVLLAVAVAVLPLVAATDWTDWRQMEDGEAVRCSLPCETQCKPISENISSGQRVYSRHVACQNQKLYDEPRDECYNTTMLQRSYELRNDASGCKSTCCCDEFQLPDTCERSFDKHPLLVPARVFVSLLWALLLALAVHQLWDELTKDKTRSREKVGVGSLRFMLQFQAASAAGSFLTYQLMRIGWGVDVCHTEH